MAREAEGYRDMLMVLMEKYPATLTRQMAQEVLGISYPTLRKAIKEKRITVQNGKIPIGSIARYLCG